MTVLQQLHKITSSTAPFFQKIERLLEFGLELSDFQIAVVSQVIDDNYVAQHVVDTHGVFYKGCNTPVFYNDDLSHTKHLSAVAFRDISNIQFSEPKGLNQLSLNTYMGAPIFVDGDVYGYISFYSVNAKHSEDGNQSTDYVSLLAQWIGAVLTQEKAYETLVRRSDALTLTGELAQIGWWEVDLEDNSVYWSEEIRVIHEVELSHLPDLETSIAFFKEGKDRDRVQKGIEQSIRLGRAWHLEARLVTARGREIWVNTAGKPFYENGKCIKLFGVMQNVDDMVRLRLSHGKKRKEAEAQLHTRNDFLTRVSRELRTPIHDINGMRQALRGEQDLGEIEHKTNVALNSANSLVDLINEVLDYSKIHHGQLTLQKYPFNLKDTFDQVCDIYQSLCSSKGLPFEADIHIDDDVWVEGDKLRVIQILSNLLNNSVKYTHSGKISLQTDIKDSAHSLVLRASIQDSGIGIEEERLSDLFTPFWANDKELEPNKGTGLGLSIVYELCKQMLGSVKVSSEAGQGSVFDFSITLEKTDQVAWPKHKDEIPDLSPLNLRILVVDDNPIHLEIMQALLAQLKLDADYAIDGYDAVHKVANAEKPYDIVFMDIVMPSMNGIDAARKIRSLNSGQLVNITALTSNSSPEDRSQCYQAGMNSFIAKPVTLNLLVESIQSSPKILASYN